MAAVLRIRPLGAAAVVAAMAAAVLGPAPPAGAGFGFGDVANDQFYSQGVGWMVTRNITTGTSERCFSPAASATRGQTATFLYREADSPPAGGSSTFTDIPVGAFYEDAVTWMVGEGITTGKSPTSFAPNDNVTRGELATFMWRAAGKPSRGAATPFSDVAPSAFYAEAVAWMVGEGITTGKSPTSFAPNDNVTRGEIATFMWRAAGSPFTVDLTTNRSFCFDTSPSSQSEPFPAPTSPTKVTPLIGEEYREDPIPRDPIVFSGSGQSAVTLPSGPARTEAWTIDATYGGEGNFIVTARDDKDQLAETLINHVDEYEGTVSYNFDPFRQATFLEITADPGALWTLELNSLDKLESVAADVGTVEAGTSDAVRVLERNGLPRRLRFGCDGCDSSIIVTGFGVAANGDARSLYVNEVGDGTPFEATFLVPDNIFLLEIIVADHDFASDTFIPNDWTIDVVP